MTTMKQQRRQYALLLIIFNVGGIILAGASYYQANYTINVEQVWINPSDPFDWTIENESIQLYGRLYYPLSYKLDNNIILFFFNSNT